MIPAKGGWDCAEKNRIWGENLRSLAVKTMLKECPFKKRKDNLPLRLKQWEKWIETMYSEAENYTEFGLFILFEKLSWVICLKCLILTGWDYSEQGPPRKLVFGEVSVNLVFAYFIFSFSCKVNFS